MGDSCAHKQSFSGFFAFLAEVVESLLHSFPEALAERLRIEAKQFRILVSVSSC